MTPLGLNKGLKYLDSVAQDACDQPSHALVQGACRSHSRRFMSSDALTCTWVQEYAVHISRLGIAPKEVPAYMELWDTIGPADKEQGCMA